MELFTILEIQERLHLSVLETLGDTGIIILKTVATAFPSALQCQADGQLSLQKRMVLTFMWRKKTPTPAQAQFRLESAMIMEEERGQVHQMVLGQHQWTSVHETEIVQKDILS
jgi:hypothetical protein